MTVSYCIVCDALPGECDHGGHRYLDPIVYTHVADEDGKHVGWNVPGVERERWENPPANVKPSKRPAGREPKPAQRLIVDLEGWMFVDRQLEQAVRDAHDREPLRVTMLVEHLLRMAKAGELTNPPGLLSTKLKEIGNAREER